MAVEALPAREYGGVTLGESEDARALRVCRPRVATIHPSRWGSGSADLSVGGASSRIEARCRSAIAFPSPFIWATRPCRASASSSDRFRPREWRWSSSISLLPIANACSNSSRRAAGAESRARLNTGLSNAGRAPAIGPSASPSTPPAKRLVPLPRLAELLLQRGAVTADQLAAVAAEYRQRGGRFCALLLRLGVVSVTNRLNPGYYNWVATTSR